MVTFGQTRAGKRVGITCEANKSHVNADLCSSLSMILRYMPTNIDEVGGKENEQTFRNRKFDVKGN